MLDETTEKDVVKKYTDYNSPKKSSDSEETTKPRSPSIVRGNDEKTLKIGDKESLIDKFFNAIISYCELSQNFNVKFVVVNHIVPTLPPFLRGLSKLGNVAIIIPKHSHTDKRIETDIKRTYPDSFYDVKNAGFSEEKRFDDHLTEGENCVKFLKEKLKLSDGEKFLIIDIGGYFSKPLHKIYKEFGDKFLGVVEDTENGHQKYLSEIYNGWENFVPDVNKFPFPVFSVARCKLKETEDYNVGKSIVEASSAIMRIDAHTILERMKTVGVMGFGKIGSSIAEHLRQKNISNVIVYDKDEIRQMKAASLGFRTVNRQEIFMKSDMIFAATGSRSIEGFDFYSLKDNVFIASCTSSDDEFDLKLIKKEMAGKGMKSILDEHYNISKYYLGSEGEEIRINLLYSGNAVNFVHGAVNGPYIYSVQASLMLSAINIMVGRKSLVKIIEEKKEIFFDELTEKEMKFIALKWLESFEGFTYSQDDFIFNKESLIKQLESKRILRSDFYLQLAFHLKKSCRDGEEFESIKGIFYFLCDLAGSFAVEEDNSDAFQKAVKGFEDFRINKKEGIKIFNNRSSYLNVGYSLISIRYLSDHNFFRVIVELIKDFESRKEKEIKDEGKELDFTFFELYSWYMLDDSVKIMMILSDKTQIKDEILNYNYKKENTEFRSCIEETVNSLNRKEEPSSSTPVLSLT
jgi:adenosylhomocysteinase